MSAHPTEQVDRVAQAIWRIRAERNPSWGGADAWEQQPDYRQHDYRAMACAALSAAAEPAATEESHECDLRDAATLQCPTCGRTLNPQQRWCPKCLKWVVGERDQ